MSSRVVGRRADGDGVRTSITKLKAAPALRRRSRFGYNRQWWGTTVRSDPRQETYWSIVPRSWPSLVFVLPLLVLYEGVIRLHAGGASEELRGAADLWLRETLGWLGMRDPWWPPFLVVVVLLGRHVWERSDWKFPPFYLAGMVLESVGLALVLIGMGKVVDLGFTHLDAWPRVAMQAGPPSVPWIDYLGAGIYEEVVFRLGLVSLLIAALDGLRTPRVLGTALTMMGSALAFSLAHHLGSPGETFTWFAFVFRWTAGIFFAWIYLERGFGIAVGAHTAYDVFVGCFGWRL